MQASRSRKKKNPSSSRQKRQRQMKIVKQNMLHVYCNKPSQAHKKNLQKLVLQIEPKNSSKLALQPDKKKRKETSDYDFPEFAIYFREKNKNNKTVQSDAIKKQAEADQSKVEPVKSRAAKNGRGSNKQIKKNVSKTALSRLREVSQYGKHQHLQKQFRQAVSKTFRMLDIFNRGKISEANINKWVPESLLYFLGKPLQKIRQQRLCLNEAQFTQLCLSVLQDSNSEDVHQFIKEANASTCLKASVNMTEGIGQENLSPIKRRMIDEEMQRSSHKKSGVSKKNPQLESVIEMIKHREEEVGQKIRELKQKRKSVCLRPLEQIQPNQCKQQEIPPQPRFESIGIQVSSFSPEKVNLGNSKKQFSLKASTNIETSLKSQPTARQKIFSFERPYIANFTFQLPQVGDISASGFENPYQKTSQFSRFKDMLIPMSEERLVSSRPLSARIDNQKVPETLVQTFRHGDENQDMRIDRLKSKIENYMRRNAEKIQKSRSFLLQMSPNHP